MFINNDIKLHSSHNDHHLKKENSILKVLAYFDQFNYPITKEEIAFFLDQHICSLELSDLLMNLKKTGTIFQAGKFYALQDDASLYEKRVKGNMRALPLLQKADKISKFLFQFPFVSAVFISGSLSKNFADENADIDFFIITKTNRLWVARTFMHLFKKLTFIFNKQHFFCMNYYIDETALQIEEKNEFTATEILTLIPSSGNNAVPRFFKQNEWVNDYYPNYSLIKNEPKNKLTDNLLKKIIEFLFQNNFGNHIDNYLMELTNKRWKQKEKNKHISKTGRRMGLRAEKHSCKPNPYFFQKKLLNKYYNRFYEIVRKSEKINEEKKSAFLN